MKHLILTSAALCTAALTAFAAPPKAGQRIFGSEELASVSNYWTPARMAAAIPRDMSASGSASAVQGSPREQLQSAPGAGPASGASTTAELGLGPELLDQALADLDPLQNTTYPHPFTRYTVLNALKSTYPYSTVGKIFFTIPGKGNFVCSGSVIRSHLILTARHCIFDYPTGTWATNVIFYPGFYNGTNNTLGGAWFARILYTWVANAGPEIGQWDIGFIQTFRKNGGQCKPDSSHRQIESYTGFLGWSFGGNFDEKHWDTGGYPAAAPFNGQLPIQCEAGTGRLNVGYPNTVEIGCDKTGGASGGPWITSFAPGVSGNVNFANSLSSYKMLIPNQPLALDGPQFLQANFKNLLDGAIALACP